MAPAGARDDNMEPGREPSGTSPQPPKRFIKRHGNEIAASVSSIIASTVSYPLDTIKNRIQVTKEKSKVWDVAVEVYKNEGVRGFWRGIAAPFASVTLVRTISLSTYSHTRAAFSSWMSYNMGFNPAAYVSTPGNLPTFGTVACFSAAGAVAGAVAACIACPFELIKFSAQISAMNGDILPTSSGQTCTPKPTRTAVGDSYKGLGTYKTGLMIIKNRGWAGLYSGLGFHLGRDIYGTAIFFSCYESTRQAIRTYGGPQMADSSLPNAIAGGMCGITSWSLIYPIDSAKAIYQKRCLRTPRGEKVEVPKIEFTNIRMYHGMQVSMARSVVLNAVMFTVLEKLKVRINNLDDDVKDLD